VISALLLALMVQAQDPVRVRAQLTHTEVRVGETTVLRVEVETDGARAQIQRIPSLPPGLELAGTRDFDHRQFTLPGGGRRFITREHVLRPASPGRYQVPAVDVVVDGARYSTQPFLLDVIGAPHAGRGSGGSEHGVVLRAWLDADTVYAGQQVTLYVETMFSQEARLRLRRAPEYEPPATSGFWVHDFPDGRAPVTRGTRGDIYETQTFRRAFFPISPGRYEIPPARLFYEMRRGLLQAPETFTVTSDPIPLVVRPVPEEGRPHTFTGAVGQFSMRGWVEPDRVVAGEAAVLTVEVWGAGNVRTLPPPSLPEMVGVDVFPPKEESDIEISGSALRGEKRFSWVIIPQQAGHVEIPEIAYSAFDPAAGEYRTSTVTLPPIQVDPGAAVAHTPPMAGLRYLKPRPAPTSPLGWVRSPWFAGAQILPVLLVAGALVRRRRRHSGIRVSYHALRRRRRDGVRDLHEAAAAGGADFLARAHSFATEWTASRLTIEPRAVARSETLMDAGLSVVTARALRDVLDRFAAARYAPSPPDSKTRQDLVLALERVLERIDREAPRPRRAAPRTATAGTAVLAALALAVPAATQGQPAATFAAGTSHFDAGRYAEAAAAYDTYVRDRPGDYAGWYNLGTAHYRAGDQGRAIWAWLHSARLQPRDPDTRHNLRIAGAAPELVSHVTPPVPLRTEEMLLLAALAWFGAAGAAAWWALRGGRAAVTAAAVALFLAIGLAATAAHSARGPDTIVALAPTSLRAGPNLHAESLATVEAGTGLVQLATEGAWVRARTRAGAEGWIETDLAGRVPAR
jgi:hypothetical protein